MFLMYYIAARYTIFMKFSEIELTIAFQFPRTWKKCFIFYFKQCIFQSICIFLSISWSIVCNWNFLNAGSKNNVDVVHTVDAITYWVLLFNFLGDIFKVRENLFLVRRRLEDQWIWAETPRSSKALKPSALQDPLFDIFYLLDFSFNFLSDDAFGYHCHLLLNGVLQATKQVTKQMYPIYIIIGCPVYSVFQTFKEVW